MTALTAYVDGIGFLGPGLADWTSAAPVLAGASGYLPQPTVVPALDVLPPAERRRTGRVVRIAITVGMQATAHARVDPAGLPTVFASSGGDGQICHELCEVLATGDRQVSPTRFHNSVHNAAAGYWSIATGAKAASIALSAYDASFAAGLLEAVTQAVVDGNAVLLIAYDAQYPEPLRAKRQIADAFGVALVLAPAASPASLARLTLSIADAAASRMPDAPLEMLRSSIPAARSLPLLRQLARREPARVIIDYLDTQGIAVEVAPCI